MFWLGGTDQFVPDQTWYWVQTEQKINSGYTDWYRTEPDHPGIYFLLICVLLFTCDVNKSQYEVIMSMLHKTLFILYFINCKTTTIFFTNHVVIFNLYPAYKLDFFLKVMTFFFKIKFVQFSCLHKQ